jgi:hypothetical protein
MGSRREMGKRERVLRGISFAYYQGLGDGDGAGAVEGRRRRVGGVGCFTGVKPTVIPRSEKVEPKPLYVCPGCSIHRYSNNMIQM